MENNETLQALFAASIITPIVVVWSFNGFDLIVTVVTFVGIYAAYGAGYNRANDDRRRG